jgi:ATP-dependent Lhr-like helicase
MKQGKKTQMPSEAQIRATLGSVGTAFFGGFPQMRDVQLRVIPPIAEGVNLLVCSATASGKTEAVIAPLIWRARQNTLRNAKSDGPRLLAIAPTRALVTDLFHRLERSLPSLGWRVGAQTSDHQGARLRPEALITTPESLDSMLVRQFLRKDGEATGHLLQHVEAVFVDEAHLFDCSPRGDQVLFLLERLRRLRSTAEKRGWISSSDIQICGASATVVHADELASRILGAGGRALTVPGSRELMILTQDGSWTEVDGSSSAESLLAKLSLGASGAQVCRRLVDVFRQKKGRKVLLFCPSRAKCDELGEYLSKHLKDHVDVWVGTHHGSLDLERRRSAEVGFAECRGLAVLVATSTLEVGIDIGDVDVVALIGPPPDVPALLQRVGRGGRREGVTRVIPFSENYEHAAALAGMLLSAARGNFEGGRRFRNWGVFVQQLSSYIMQNAGRGRPRHSLIELAEAVWPGDDTSDLANAIIDDLLVGGGLSETKNRFFLDGPIIKRIDERPTSAHSNIRSGASVVPIRDASSGEIIGHVAGGPLTGLTNVGGQLYGIVAHTADEIVVSSDARSQRRAGDPAPVRYPTVPFLISRRYCREVARGVGLAEDDAPLTDAGGRRVWWHFGGQAVEKLLRLVAPAVFVGVAVKGLALFVEGDVDVVKQFFKSNESVRAALERVISSARSRYSRSSFDDFFSPFIFARVASEALQPDDLMEFFTSRKIRLCPLSDPVGPRLAQLL